MQKVVIEGPVSLRGEIDISGSKNASLPIMISTVLAKGSCLKAIKIATNAINPEIHLKACKPGLLVL